MPQPLAIPGAGMLVQGSGGAMSFRAHGVQRGKGQSVTARSATRMRRVAFKALLRFVRLLSQW